MKNPQDGGSSKDVEPTSQMQRNATDRQGRSSSRVGKSIRSESWTIGHLAWALAIAGVLLTFSSALRNHDPTSMPKPDVDATSEQSR